MSCLDEELCTLEEIKPLGESGKWSWQKHSLGALARPSAPITTSMLLGQGTRNPRAGLAVLGEQGIGATDTEPRPLHRPPDAAE